MVKVRILDDVDIDKLEKKINDFLEHLDPAKFLDIKMVSESSPSELSITRSAVIIYND